MKKTIFFFFSLMMLLGCGSPQHFTRCYYTRMVEKFFLPDIKLDILNYATNRNSRVDILFEVPFKNLKFEKEGNKFTAYYSLTFSVLDRDDKTVATWETSKTLSVNTYAETTIDRYDPGLHSFMLGTGEYSLEVTISDGRSLQQRLVTRKFFVRPENTTIAASDLMLLNDVAEANGVHTISPIHPDDLGKGKELASFQEVYDSLSGDTIWAVTSLRKFTLDYEKKHTYNPFNLNEYFMTSGLFTPHFDTAAIYRDTMFVSKNQPSQIFSTFKIPPPGDYQIVSKVSRYHDGKVDTIAIGRSLMIHNPNFPAIRDVDELIAPLAYIAFRNEFDSLTAPPDKIERARRLEEFWAKTLNTSLRQEFYLRVQQANELFNSYVEGWRTPMGMVYIVAGQPDQVTCEVYNEAWAYEYQQNYAIFRFGISPEMRFAENPVYTFYSYPPDAFWSSCVYRWRR